jgi:hypothetical protein
MSVCHKAGGFHKQVATDSHGIFVGGCAGQTGVGKKPAALGFELAVTNPPDPLLRDDDLTLVQDDDGSTIVVGNA